MTDNPFEPPKSQISDLASTNKPGSIWLGVIVGGAVDIGGTSLFGLAMFVIYIVINISAEITPDEIISLTEEFTRIASSYNSIYGIISFTIGLLFSLLGGYICAYFAREKWKMAVLILAVSVSVLGTIMAFEYYSPGKNLLLALLTLIVIVFGGWLNQAWRKKSA